MGKGMDINRVGGTAPGLYLLGYFLGVRGSEHASVDGIFKVVWKGVEKMRYGVRQTHGSEDARAKKGVAAQSIEQRILRAWNIRMDPLKVGKLLDGKFAHRPFFAFANPF
jgi:hypothetical protein